MSILNQSPGSFCGPLVHRVSSFPSIAFLASPLFLDPEYKRIVPDYSAYTRRLDSKPMVEKAVEKAKSRKKK